MIWAGLCLRYAWVSCCFSLCYVCFKRSLSLISSLEYQNTHISTPSLIRITIKFHVRWISSFSLILQFHQLKQVIYSTDLHEETARKQKRLQLPDGSGSAFWLYKLKSIPASVTESITTSSHRMFRIVPANEGRDFTCTKWHPEEWGALNVSTFDCNPWKNSPRGKIKVCTMYNKREQYEVFILPSQRRCLHWFYTSSMWPKVGCTFTWKDPNFIHRGQRTWQTLR